MKISAVLPVKIEPLSRDGLARAAILLQSLLRFLRLEDLHVLYVVHHERDAPQAFRAALQRFAALPIELIDEADLVPGLAGTSPGRYRRRWFRRVRGHDWYRQQVVKLWAAERIETDFYLTLDADVICTRPTCAADLLVGDRAILDLERRTVHPGWWAASSRVLGVPDDPVEWGTSVTPVLLSREIVRGLLAFLAERGGRRGAVELLLSARGWSEYTLYDLFARKSGLLERHHHLDPHPERPSRAIRRRDALWRLDPDADEAGRERILADWAERAFDPAQPGHFSLVQSNTGLRPEEVWRAVRDRIAPGAPAPWQRDRA